MIQTWQSFVPTGPSHHQPFTFKGGDDDGEASYLKTQRQTRMERESNRQPALASDPQWL